MTVMADAAWTREAWVRAETNATLFELEATLREATSLEERVAALGDAAEILVHLENLPQ